MEWKDYIDPAHASVRELDEWVVGLAPFAQDFVLGEIAALRELAAAGDIPVGDRRLDPIRVDPDVYELRWTLLSKKVRQYHGEPRRMPAELVRLHIHIKALIDGNQASTKAIQDAEIRHARLRYRIGERTDWEL